MISATDLSPRELAALLHFHADAGVEWLLEETPVDRFAEFAAANAARAANRQAPVSTQRVDRPVDQAVAASGPSTPARTSAARSAAPPPPAPTVAIPDEQAIAEARFAADSARTLAELKAAMEAFTSCNLKNSARTMVFADGDPASGLMVIGPMPNGDDDRDGLPFSGKQGQMLERMLAGIGIARNEVLLTNIIPWRPPGARMPSVRETDICRPFIERQIALAEPRHILILGNFAARFFFGGSETIHNLRGEWRDLKAGSWTAAALPTFHPQDLMSAPASKRLAWADLLAFQARIRP
ncbi:uracil-DNA glycosylase [Pararhizobium sp.]|uniref:uracil-DNA glycosylase n=1 Tax=Pararhizobium sp. TaxID=1977563 RepID=UPI002717349E|nr:uracil-DNA glycosylase [Pararhizobium sp.]MDO9418006.1 uracil-DNA glycosylase [Pararhizobium sp.]